LPCRSVGSSMQCYGRHGPVIESGPAYESRRLNHRLTCSEFYDPETSPPSEACQWRRQQTRVMPNSHHLFVSRTLRRCELDFRQLKTVADRNLSLNALIAIVQFVPPRQTRHGQHCLVLTGGRCELNISFRLFRAKMTTRCDVRRAYLHGEIVLKSRV